MLAELLSQAGYKVRSTEKPQLAIDSALSNPPALILLDVAARSWRRRRRLEGGGQCRQAGLVFGAHGILHVFGDLVFEAHGVS